MILDRCYYCSVYIYVCKYVNNNIHYNVFIKFKNITYTFNKDLTLLYKSIYIKIIILNELKNLITLFIYTYIYIYI